ncbi:MAG: hypothetical protein HY650_06395 [Acidobacteria bacterium]|nr:hypothetical protein [Acidobacteriota bacterium]
MTATHSKDGGTSEVQPVAPDTQFPITSIRADKVGSSTVNLGLTDEVTLAFEGTPVQGSIVAVRTLTDSATYNQLELPSGRLAKINPGDVIIGVLGRRRALKGFVGDVPDVLHLGDRLHILNLGGVIGRCSGHHHALGGPIEAEFLGYVTGNGRPLRLSDGALAPRSDLPGSAPLVLVAGTCMNSGKTHAAVELIKQMARRGYRVAGAKLTGVACLRDTLHMADHGAVETRSFLDCGLPSTVDVTDLPDVAKALVADLNGCAPDAIILELGDGLLGGYNVESILEDEAIMRRAAALVFCASDFVGAWGGKQWLASRSIAIDVVSGSVTDSQMGIEFIEREMGLPAANALHGGDRLFRLVEERIKAWPRSE